MPFAVEVRGDAPGIATGLDAKGALFVVTRLPSALLAVGWCSFGRAAAYPALSKRIPTLPIRARRTGPLLERRSETRLVKRAQKAMLRHEVIPFVEQVRMPAYPIIDSHVHLWDPARLPLRWGEKVPSINVPHLVPDYDAALADVEVAAMVFLECDVEPGRHIDEVAMVSEIAATEPRLQAIVAHAPLEKGEAVAEDLEELARYPLVRGIRRILQDEPDIQAVLDDDFIAGLNLLPRNNLHFEICVYHHQLDAIVDLVRRLPNVTFMLDHIGKPPIAAQSLDPWRIRIAELAALPNLMCKLSGLNTEADRANWQPADLRPYIDHVVDAFGFDRLVFGSDWPVLTLAGSLPQWVGILDEALGGASDDELRYFWVDNAQAFYRIGES